MPLGPVLGDEDGGGGLSNSWCAAELGKRLITCGKIDKNDRAAGVALLLSPRCAAAVSDQGTLAPDNASRARICWCRIDAKANPVSKDA